MSASAPAAERAAVPMAPAPASVVEVQVEGFRSARTVVLRPGRVCALVGEGGVGKSNLLHALWLLLEPRAEPPARDDCWRGGRLEIRMHALLADGGVVTFHARPPGPPARSGTPPPVVLLPAALRGGALVAAPAGAPGDGLGAMLADAAARAGSAGGAATALVDVLETWCDERPTGVVLLLEEPELFLPPQTERYLYRLLRTFAANGNQVVYSTHAPAFLNVARLDEVVRIEHTPARGTTVVVPEPLPPDETFRALSELDAERAELFLARAALLVEGRTEKLALPLVFRALGYDPDREGISIVEAGGKPNLPLLARSCAAMRVPYVVLHDRDAGRSRAVRRAERVLNETILAVAGPGRVVELAPDFEGVAGLRGHDHKPARAWRAFVGAGPGDVPPPLAEAVRRVVELARGAGGISSGPPRLGGKRRRRATPSAGIRTP